MNEAGQEYEVKEGEYLILVPGLEHFGYRECGENTHFYWFHFQAEKPLTLSEKHSFSWTDVLIEEETFTEPAVFLLRIPQYGMLQNRELGERLLEELVQAGDSISIEEKLRQPLLFYRFLLLLQKEALAIPSAAEKVSEQAAAYIGQHYTEEVKMADIAEQLHYHVDYITRCMQKTMGISPLQYLNEIRISRAKRLLETTNEKVKSIAKQVGIQDETYFSRMFRKKEGMSPQVYRRMTQREGKGK